MHKLSTVIICVLLISLTYAGASGGIPSGSTRVQRRGEINLTYFNEDNIPFLLKNSTERTKRCGSLILKEKVILIPVIFTCRWIRVFRLIQSMEKRIKCGTDVTHRTIANGRFVETSERPRKY